MSNGAAHSQDANREKAMRTIQHAIDILSPADQSQVEECLRKLGAVRDEYGWLGFLAVSKLAIQQGGKQK